LYIILQFCYFVQKFCFLFRILLKYEELSEYSQQISQILQIVIIFSST